MSSNYVETAEHLEDFIVLRWVMLNVMLLLDYVT